MCVVSAVGDEWGKRFPDRWPTFVPYVTPAVQPHEVPHAFEPIQDDLKTCNVCGFRRDAKIHILFEASKSFEFNPQSVSKKDFDALREEVKELRELLLAAKRFDEETGQPDCEMDEKVALIRRVAELVGVDVDEVFGKGVGEA